MTAHEDVGCSGKPEKERERDVDVLSAAISRFLFALLLIFFLLSLFLTENPAHDSTLPVWLRFSFFFFFWTNRNACFCCRAAEDDSD